MKIETKFNVGDLTQRKYDRYEDNIKGVFEIMELSIQVCYSTVQIFYYAKPLIANKISKSYGHDEKIYWTVGHGLGKEDNSSGWRKYREDELIPADKETIKIITGK